MSDLITGGSGTVTVVCTSIAAVLGAVRLAAPTIRDVIAEWRRPSTKDYQELIRVLGLMRELVRKLNGTYEWEQLDPSLRERIEKEIE